MDQQILLGGVLLCPTPFCGRASWTLLLRTLLMSYCVLETVSTRRLECEVAVTAAVRPDAAAFAAARILSVLVTAKLICAILSSAGVVLDWIGCCLRVEELILGLTSFFFDLHDRIAVVIHQILVRGAADVNNEFLRLNGSYHMVPRGIRPGRRREERIGVADQTRFGIIAGSIFIAIRQQWICIFLRR
ncbi:hypothetical protein BCR43DRAFT_497973 [Syncephalastrum racemosum]|uniref:Uncharacterized protein n=1 Tax=Syncephalastrum racemosum TaxID=13706 RepID=A0A1X2H350_SYNRA|nr:hypothetical protein BCR43DRAFT_497973 [Syncephalastrum racemosum]